MKLIYLILFQKRAIKLQLHVEKEAYVKSQQLKMEEDLIAKM